MQTLSYPKSVLLALLSVGAGLVAIFQMASQGTFDLLASFLLGVILTVLSFFALACVKKVELRFERQLRELEMEAHKHSITAPQLDEYVKNQPDLKDAEQIFRAESRVEKLSLILEQFGFSRSHGVLREIRQQTT